MSRKEDLADKYINNVSKNKKLVEDWFSVFQNNEKMKDRIKDYLIDKNILDAIHDETLLSFWIQIGWLKQEIFEEMDKVKSIINDKDKSEEEIKTEIENIINRHTENDPNKEKDVDSTTNSPDNYITSWTVEMVWTKFKGKEKEVRAVILYLEKAWITNPLVIKAILCTIWKESWFDISRPEISYINTWYSRIKRIFWSRAPSKQELKDWKAQGEEIFNNNFWDRVYGWKYGNIDEWDGSKYRGRWFNGITFKSNYKHYWKKIKEKFWDERGDRLANEPELLSNLEVASEVNACYFDDLFNKGVTKKKYNYSNINTDIKDFNTALRLAVHVTWWIWKWKDSKVVNRGYDNAMKNIDEFKIISSGDQTQEKMVA